MPKIRKFNIKLSVYQVQQILRRKKFPFTEETIAVISALCDDLKAKIAPAVYFETFHDMSRGGVKLDLPAGAAALSVVASTIGPGAEEFISQRNVPESSGGELAAAVVAQAADETKRFAWKIISDAAEEEKCALGEKIPVTAPPVLESMKEMLSKIEIFPTENGLKPVYSFVEVAHWLPLKKKSKN